MTDIPRGQNHNSTNKTKRKSVQKTQKPAFWDLADLVRNELKGKAKDYNIAAQDNTGVVFHPLPLVGQKQQNYPMLVMAWLKDPEDLRRLLVELAIWARDDLEAKRGRRSTLNQTERDLLCLEWMQLSGSVKLDDFLIAAAPGNDAGFPAIDKSTFRKWLAAFKKRKGSKPKTITKRR